MAISKVMVVDDSATERHVLGDILGKKGFRWSMPKAAKRR